MKPDEAKALLGKALFLDVREPYEWDAGHVEGSLHIPITEITERMNELDTSRQIVVVCQVGQCSEFVAEWLNSQKVEAHNLEGGLVAWTARGFSLTAPDTPSGQLADGWARDLTGNRFNPDED